MQAPNSFLFTLTNIYGTNPTKFQLKNNNDSSAIYNDSSFGAYFGGGNDLYVINNFFNNCSDIYFPYSYQDNIGKGKSIFIGDPNNRNVFLKIKNNIFIYYKYFQLNKVN